MIEEEKRSILVSFIFMFCFLIIVYLSLLRLFILDNDVFLFVEFSFLGVFGVIGQPLPFPSPSNSSSNLSYAWCEAFDIGVLLKTGSE